MAERRGQVWTSLGHSWEGPGVGAGGEHTLRPWGQSSRANVESVQPPGREGPPWIRSHKAASPPHAKLPLAAEPPLGAHAGPAICRSPSFFSPLQGSSSCPSSPSLVSPVKHQELSYRGKEVSCVLMGCGLQKHMHLLKLINATLKAFYCMEIFQA